MKIWSILNRMLPIRKTKPSQVALTSYYNKTFINRSDRAESNFDKWFAAQLRLRAISNKEDRLVDVKYADIDLSSVKGLPRQYSTLARVFRSFQFGEMQFYFEYDKRIAEIEKLIGLDVTEIERSSNLLAIGTFQNNPLLMDRNNIVYVYIDGQIEPVDSFVNVLGIDLTKAPVEYITMGVSNKELPIGFVLGWRLGWQKLLERLEVRYSVHQRGERISIAPDQYIVPFADQIYVFDRSNYYATLVLAGFRRYAKIIANFNSFEFDRKDVYNRVLEEAGLSSRLTKELNTLFKVWVDPITKSILEIMQEPTDYEGLLFRAVELLTDDWSPAETDGAYMRARGYERMTGVVFSELNNAVKRYVNSMAQANAVVGMDQHAVWRRVTQDPTVSTIEDSNPIANLREQEAITYRGDGGRTSVSMVARTRVFHESDIGTISESTVDSGDVGVVAYSPPDPSYINLLGMSKPIDPLTAGPAQIFSTSSLLAVAAGRDDQIGPNR